MISETSNVLPELELEQIKTKLMHVESGEGWSVARTGAVEAEYRRFLYLMKKFPNEQAGPSVDVDTFWHYHILDTAKYAADCELVFGYFLHHYPYIGLRGEGDDEVHRRSGERMRELYEQTFAESYDRGQARAAKAAYCAVTNEAAYCAVTSATAYCAATAKQSYCAVTAKPAYCAATAQPAYCAATAGQSYCAATSKPAYCAAATSPSYCAATSKPAYCAATAKQSYCAATSKPAYCAVTNEPAYCAAAKSAYCAATGKTAAANVAQIADAA